MNRTVLASLGLALTLGLPFAGTALASGPIRFPADNQPADFGAGQLCAFPVHVGVVVDRETISLWLDGDGQASHLLITGDLVLSVTNTDNGKSIDVDVPGPVRIDLNADGSSVWTFYGPSLIGALPAPLPGGGLYVNRGSVTMSDTAANDVAIIAEHGHATDLCGPLS